VSGGAYQGAVLPIMGARVRLKVLPQNIDNDFGDLPEYERIILRALAKYGAIIHDTGTLSFELEADSSRTVFPSAFGNDKTWYNYFQQQALLDSKAQMKITSWRVCADPDLGFNSDGGDCTPELEKESNQLVAYLTPERWLGDLEFVTDPCWKQGGNCASQTGWHTGEFSALDSTTEQLVLKVKHLMHPDGGSYSPNTANRETQFKSFALDLLQELDNARLPASGSGSWCKFRTPGGAGYTVERLYEMSTGRWLIYASDAYSNGSQAHFLFNPEFRRNIVIEVPHAGGTEGDIAVQGARLFLSTGARALLINGHARCSLRHPRI
jgi:hypothetical protein